MIYMVGSTCAASLCSIRASIPDVGMLLYPSGWRVPPPSPSVYALDNGVYAAWMRGGRVWDIGMSEDWLSMLNKIPSDNLPWWVLLPDAVSNWPATMAFAELYLPLLRERHLPVCVALQDGCNFADVLQFEPDWVFVGGSTLWKEEHISPACRFFHDEGIKVHVGRVNTKRRLRLCQLGGADSCDGTSLNRFRTVNLPVLSGALAEPLLPLFG